MWRKYCEILMKMWKMFFEFLRQLFEKQTRNKKWRNLEMIFQAIFKDHFNDYLAKLSW